MRLDELQPDYQSTIGAFARVVRGNANHARRPRQVAKAILQMADEPTHRGACRSAANAVFLAPAWLVRRVSP